MPIITLPDGNKLDFPKKVTGLEVAEKISKSLAKQAIVISIDGELKDLDYLIEKIVLLRFLRPKMMRVLKQLDMIQHMYWPWLFKNFFQALKSLSVQLLKMAFIMILLEKNHLLKKI